MSVISLIADVKQHLLKQNERSMFGNKCAYRGSHGRKCAVGYLIPENEYNEGMETRTVESINENFKGVISRIAFKYNMGLSDCYEILRDLQTIHDELDVSIWEQCLINLEKEHA